MGKHHKQLTNILKNMENKQAPIHMVEEKHEQDKRSNHYTFDIKKTLLAKYKPSKGLKVLDRGNSRHNEKEVA